MKLGTQSVKDGLAKHKGPDESGDGYFMHHILKWLRTMKIRVSVYAVDAWGNIFVKDIKKKSLSALVFMAKDGHLYSSCGNTDFNRSLANKIMIELESRVQWCACPQETFVIDPEKLQSDLKDNGQNIFSQSCITVYTSCSMTSYKEKYP